MSEELAFHVINHVGLITLNRPKALNALSHAMVAGIEQQLVAWERDPDIRAVVFRGAGDRAFCAGGDIRALYHRFHEAPETYWDYFVDEYRLDYMIHCYPKPTVTLMDGLVMGGGMGIAQGTTLRVVSEHSQLAMPETAIGLFPDVGASGFLAHLPLELALYIGISGVTIGTADALFAGLADICVARHVMADIDHLLAGVTWRDDPLEDLRAALLARGVVATGSAPLERLMPAITRHFSPSLSVSGMLASLTAEDDPCYQEWAAETAATLRQRSPLSMSVTRRQLLQGRNMTLADCFRMELGLVYRTFDEGDMIEGVRALMIDKDRSPKWRITHIEHVEDHQIDRIFASPWHGEDHPLAGLTS
jgi:enoyl-CoA hydratase/carnithine racemase